MKQPYSFNAVVTPSYATPPITYAWSPEPESGQGAGTAIYRWDTYNEYQISVTASNFGGGSEAVHDIEIVDLPCSYVHLSVVLR